MIVFVCSRFSNLFAKRFPYWMLIWIGLYSDLLWGIDLPEGVQFHGFASQGYSLTNKNYFFGDSQGNGSFQYREMGANISWLPVSYLQLSSQLLWRQAGETDPGQLKLDYGLLDYTIVSDETNRWGLRLGRVKNPTGFYNETRDVVFTRPSILLPQSIYPDSIRSLSLSSDGVYLYGEHRASYGDLFFHAAAGYPQAIDRELEPFFFGQKLAGKFDSGLSYITRLLYEWNGGEIRSAITYFRAKLDYNSSEEPFPYDVPSGITRIQPWIFSLQYNSEKWSLTTEYSLRQAHATGFGQSSNTSPQKSYYIQGTYRFYPDWEALLRYDVDYQDRRHTNGKRYAESDPFGRPAYNWYAKDLTLGLSWSIAPQFIVRGEYHHVNGTRWLPALDNTDQNDTDRNWDIFLVMASYRF